MSDDSSPLSPRHERFVAEYLKDGNATQAYIRAGYKPSGAQVNSSKLLRQPRIEAALKAGRRRITAALDISVEHIAAEYAKVAFASIDDFITVDGDGRVRIDLAKADRAKRDGLIELSVSEHGEERLQRVKIKLGKLQALGALVRQLGALAANPAQEVTREDYDLLMHIAVTRRGLLDQQAEQLREQERELAETRAALAAAQARPGAAGLETPSSSPPEDRPPSMPHEPEPPDQRAPEPPARAPVWPEPGAPLPARGTPEHAALLRQLRRGELSSAIAARLLMSG